MPIEILTPTSYVTNSEYTDYDFWIAAFNDAVSGELMSIAMKDDVIISLNKDIEDQPEGLRALNDITDRYKALGYRFYTWIERIDGPNGSHFEYLSIRITPIKHK